jgi:hypothetical protein
VGQLSIGQHVAIDCFRKAKAFSFAKIFRDFLVAD